MSKRIFKNFLRELVGAHRRGAPLLARQRRSINRRTARRAIPADDGAERVFPPATSPAGMPESAGWKPALPETRLPSRQFSRGASASLSVKRQEGRRLPGNWCQSRRNGANIFRSVEVIGLSPCLRMIRFRADIVLRTGDPHKPRITPSSSPPPASPAPF